MDAIFPRRFLIGCVTLNKSTGEEEAGYYTSFVNLKNVFEPWNVFMMYSQSTYLCKLLLFYHEHSNLGDEILLGGRNVRPDFSNIDWSTQDDNVIHNWVSLYWFY